MIEYLFDIALAWLEKKTSSPTACSYKIPRAFAHATISTPLHKIKKPPSLLYHVRVWACSGTITFGKGA